MQKGNSYSEDVKILKIIESIISIFSTSLTILSFFGYTANGNYTFIIIGFIMLFNTILLYLKRRKISSVIMIKLMNFTVPDTNIEIVDKTVNYEYIAIDKFQYECRFKIKVNSEPINEFNDKIKWTAGAITKIDPIVKGHTVTLVDCPSNSQIILCAQDFTIKFGHNREITKKDDPVPTGFKISDLNDPERKAVPILCVGIYDKTYNLTLRVTFDKTLNPTNIRFLKYSHFNDKSPYEIVYVPLEYDENAEKRYVEYKIKNPIYGGKYTFDWVLDNLMS